MRTPNKLVVVLLAAFSLLIYTSSKAAENGEIRINVLGEDGAPAFGAIVTLISAEQAVDRKNADNDGNVIFKEIPPGKYDLKVEMMTMVTHIKKNVEVTSGTTTYVNIRLKENSTLLDSIEIFPYEAPIIVTGPGGGLTLPLSTIENLPGPHNDIVMVLTALSSDLQPTPDGKDLYSRGARRGSNVYMVDGEKVIGSFSVPSQSIWSMTLYTGGVPAAYGDFTGGLVMITTKSFFNGVQQKRQMYEEISRHRKEKE